MMRLSKMFLSLLFVFYAVNAYSHGISPVEIDVGLKPYGIKFPVKIRVYNNNAKPFPVEVFIRNHDKSIKILGKTSLIQPGGYAKGLDINVILNAINGTTEVCTKMDSDNLNVNTVICTRVKMKTLGEYK